MKALRVPLLLFALPALVVAFAPARGGLLLLDRAALGAGESWRLWTGHWVHFSTSHLLWNLAVLLAAGAWLERAQPGRLLRHTLVAAPLVSLTLLNAEPALQSYGGLSALATSVVTLLALTQLAAGRADRPLWTALLLFVAGKCLYDFGHTHTLFSRFDSPAVRPSVFAHAAGAGIAFLLWLAWHRHEARPAAPAENGTAGTRDGLPAARFR